MKEAKLAKASTTTPQGESAREAGKQAKASTTVSQGESAAGGTGTEKSSAMSSNGGEPMHSGEGPQESATTDAVSLIKADHRKVEGLFSQCESAGSEDDKAKLVKQVCSELIVHAMIEEEILYPACRLAGVDDDELDEAQVEHDSAKMLIHELLSGEPGEDYYDAQVKVLAEYVKHHVAEEEDPKNGILVKAQQAGIDMNRLGQKLKARKAELMQRVDRNELTIPVPRSFHSDPFSQPEHAKEYNMDRYQNTPDRDERGRFVSDDEDDRRGRGYSSQSRSRDDDDYQRSSRGGHNDDDYGRRSRSRNDDDDDRHSSRGGRSGWSGDPEGHSEAARKGWESRRSDDDDDRRYSRSRNDDDDRRHSRSRNDDDDGRHSRSRNDDDDRRHSRSRNDDERGRGGWFGDSEGHSQAARKGWNNPDHRESGWFGDSEGHSEAARRGWQNPQHGESGWFGDPRGHSEASRKGWGERDDYRSSRGRYSDDDDDRRRSRSR